MIISHNALIHALNDYSAFGVVLFLFVSAGHTVLSINYSSAVGMSVIDGGGGLVSFAKKRHYCRKEICL